MLFFLWMIFVRELLLLFWCVIVGLELRVFVLIFFDDKEMYVVLGMFLFFFIDNIDCDNGEFLGIDLFGEM